MVKKNKYGYYELINKPSENELKEYYKMKYYQEEKSTYQLFYSEEEIKYTLNKIDQKFHALKKFLPSKEKFELLDVGCGEGFCIKYFKDKGWNALGCDFSDFGIKKHNPKYANNVLVGDIYEQLMLLVNKKRHFDLIWLDNVLEHVFNPIHLLKLCKKLVYKNGILIVEVPNDFSLLHQKLYDKKLIDNNFWIAIPDHISYFNREGLIRICEEAKWYSQIVLSDFPIDFNLANPNSNYIADKMKGKGAHEQRIFLDNLFHSISIEDTNKLYKIFADMGLGRQVIGIFTSSKTKIY